MVDLNRWSMVGEFTLEQAACLWAGIDPTEYDRRRYAPDHTLESEVAPYLQMLSGAISRGDLKVDSRTNAFASIGDYRKSTVSKQALLELVRLRQLNLPPFLTPRDVESVRQNMESATPRRAGRPPEIDWRTCLFEVICYVEEHPDGLPQTHADLERVLAQWFVDSDRKAPSDTSLKNLVRELYEYRDARQKRQKL